MKKLVGMVFAIGLMIGLMPGKIVRANTDKADVNYLKAIVGTDNVVTFETDNAECTIVKQDTDNDVVWENGWYAVTGEIEINGRITINDGADVNLILCDDCGLNAKKGIYVPLNSTLNIYSGSTEDNIKGNGKLDATGDTGYAGIGGNNGESGNCGKIVINGGHITATGGDHGAGIGGGIKGDGGIIVIYGGTVKATGGSGASGIGIGQFDKEETSMVYDATLNVYGGSIEAIGGVGSFYGSEPHRVPGGAGIYCKIDHITGNASIIAKGGNGATNAEGAYVSDGGDGISGSINVKGDSPKIEATGGDGSTAEVDGSIAGSGIRLRQTDQTVLTALTVSGGSPTITATGGNTTNGRAGKGISIGTVARSTALVIASGSPQIISMGGNSISGKGGDGIYGPITITTDSDIASVLAIRGDGKEAYAISGAATVSAGFAAFNRMSEDALWNIDSEINGSQTTTITRESFVIENKYGRIFKSYYSLVLDQNGGSGIIVDPLYYELGETITVPANTFTRNGYSFTGWNTEPNGSGKSYSVGASVEYNDYKNGLDEFSQFILYAQWTKDESSSTGGGTETETQKTGTEGGQQKAGDDPAKQTKVAAPGKVTIGSAENDKKGTVTIKIKTKKTDPKVDGYEVVSATSKKKLSKVKKAKTFKKTSIKLKKLKKGKTYYFKVRAFNKETDGKKVYGKWSKVVKIKVKK